MSHTKGEWRIQTPKQNDGGKYWAILNDRAENKYCVGFFYTNSNVPEGEDEANARLIAAAPDMLEALLFMATQMQEQSTAIMINAIQKATGMSYNEVLEHIKKAKGL